MSGQPVSASGTQAVDRAALLISTVVGSADPVSFAELAEECELPKSTASRLLTALERTELLERTDAGAYVPGPLFWRYAARHDPYVDIAELSAPILKRVGESTGETVHLGMPRGERVIHVAQVDSRFLLGTRDWTQLDVPTHASALGKVLHAYGALAAPTSPLERLTDATITHLGELAADLAAVRRHGYAVTVDELELGLTAVAAPVRSADGEVIAALGISGPTPRLQDRLADLGQLLTKEAKRLGALLRHSSPKEGVA